MVRKPAFKLIAEGQDITARIAKNLISLTYNDKEGDESDDVNISLHGLYQDKAFGSKLELYLGYVGDLFLCGSFTLQTIRKDYVAQTTELVATSANFSSQQKERKSRLWKDTNLEDVVRKITEESGLNFSTDGNAKNTLITSVEQNNVSDIEFMYTLCNQRGFLCMIKNNSVVVRAKAVVPNTVLSHTTNTNLPKFGLKFTELTAFTLEEANRDNYNAVTLEYQDMDAGEIKTIRVGVGEITYKIKAAQPQTAAEALQVCEAKLKELQKGSTTGSIETTGRKLLTGGKLKIDMIAKEFSITSVTHSLSTSGYTVSAELEG